MYLGRIEPPDPLTDSSWGLVIDDKAWDQLITAIVVSGVVGDKDVSDKIAYDFAGEVVERILHPKDPE